MTNVGPNPLISLQVPSVPHVTAGGAATAKKALLEKNATDVQMDPLDQMDVRNGEDSVSLYRTKPAPVSVLLWFLLPGDDASPEE